ncbi:MAG TPA: thioesterase family protein [Solirubrobacteraceae bacterium]|nr:thioesterase family protein [Solirubrobacteraceae bacterium]
MSESVFERVGGAWAPTAHARGPWDPHAQHGGAPAALLAREIEWTEPGTDMTVARITYEFLGPVPLRPLTAVARVTRPGRRLQLVEAELRDGGRAVVRARAVRLRRGAVELPADARTDEPVPCPGPEQSQSAPFPTDGPAEGFHRSAMEIRFAAGTAYGGGPAYAWFRFARPLVAGEEPSPLQLAAAAADFGNGVSSILDFGEHLFVNTDLTLHLAREPAGDWVLLDARTLIEAHGAGLAFSRLFDLRGPIGLAAQSLYVEPR